MEKNIAQCANCEDEMVYQVIDLDVSVPLNRGDLIFISKLLYTAYCEHGLKNADSSDHIWAHRLMTEFEALNPTDLPLASFKNNHESGLINMLIQVFGPDNFKVINLDNDE